MCIAELPFATSLMATYLEQGHGESLAAGVYAGSLLVMSVAFAALMRLILLRRPHMLSEELSERRRRTILFRSRAGLVPYAAALGLAAVSRRHAAICGAVALYYASPRERRLIKSRTASGNCPPVSEARSSRITAVCLPAAVFAYAERPLTAEVQLGLGRERRRLGSGGALVLAGEVLDAGGERALLVVDRERYFLNLFRAPPSRSVSHTRVSQRPFHGLFPCRSSMAWENPSTTASL